MGAVKVSMSRRLQGDERQDIKLSLHFEDGNLAEECKAVAEGLRLTLELRPWWDECVVFIQDDREIGRWKFGGSPDVAPRSPVPEEMLDDLAEEFDMNGQILASGPYTYQVDITEEDDGIVE